MFDILSLSLFYLHILLNFLSFLRVSIFLTLHISNCHYYEEISTYYFFIIHVNVYVQVAETLDTRTVPSTNRTDTC
jgi:hypothetical protein